MGKGRKSTGEPENTGAGRYDEELLSANWNPVIPLLEWSCARTAADVAENDEAKVSEDDAESFLRRIYKAGT